MMRWMIGSSLKFRRLIVALAAGLIALGIFQLGSLRSDILPEFDRTRVEVQTEALGLSAEEVEQLITVPLEQDLLNGVAFLEEIESVSMPGLSSVVMTFAPGTGLLDARQVVAERLTQAVGVAGLPQVADLPQMIQPVSSTSRVAMVRLTSETMSPIEMSVLARWRIVPRLLGVEGVANVAIWGFRDRQLQVLVDPATLAANGVRLDDVIRTAGNALEVSNLSFLEASSPGTGGFIDTPNQRLHVFHEQAITTPEQLAQVPIERAAPAPGTSGEDGAPVAPVAPALTLGDVSRVTEDHQPLIGDAECGAGECVLLVVEKFPGVNLPEVAAGVDEALELLRPGLTDIAMDTGVYRPAAFVKASLDNLGRVLLIGAALAVLVVAAFAASWRSAMVVVAAVATSLAVAWAVLALTRTTLNAMVLAGLVLGLVIIVDDAISETDNLASSLRAHRESGHGAPVWSVITDAGVRLRTPLVYAALVVVAAAVPVFFLPGPAGAFLPHIVAAYLLAIVASLLVALTVTPALAMLLLAARRPGRNGSGARADEAPPFTRWVRRSFERHGTRLIGTAAPALAVAAVLVVAGVGALPFLTQDMRPALRERDVQVEIAAPAGTSLPRMDEITAAAVDRLATLEGVEDVVAHVGRAVASDQIVNVNAAEVWVSIAPDAPYEATVDAIGSVAGDLPDVTTDVLTYGEQRVRDILSEADHALTVRIYGEDPAVLAAKGEEIRAMLAGVPGVADARVLTGADEPTIEVVADAARARAFGIKPGDVRRTAATLLSGLTVGNLFDEQKVFDVVVWGVPEIRQTPDDVGNIMIDAPDGRQVRLADVASVEVAPRPTQIRHESVGTYLDVVADVRGRPAEAATADVRTELAAIEFPIEHHAEILGDDAERRAQVAQLVAVGVAVAVAIFLLLQAAFMSWRLALFGFVVLPIALSGGALAVLLTGRTLTLGGVAGFLAVLGLAARGLIVLVRDFTRLDTRDARTEGIAATMGERAAPMLASAAAIALLFLPAALSGGAIGLEIVAPMAQVVIGGLLTTLVVLLLVLPGAYRLLGPRGAPARAERFDDVALLEADLMGERPPSRGDRP